jgi:hypothetical protein
VACMMLEMRSRGWCGDGMRCRAVCAWASADAGALAMWQRLSPSHFHVSFISTSCPCLRFYLTASSVLSIALLRSNYASCKCYDVY